MIVSSPLLRKIRSSLRYVLPVLTSIFFSQKLGASNGNGFAQRNSPVRRSSKKMPPDSPAANSTARSSPGLIRGLIHLTNWGFGLSLVCRSVRSLVQSSSQSSPGRCWKYHSSFPVFASSATVELLYRAEGAEVGIANGFPLWRAIRLLGVGLAMP